MDRFLLSAIRQAHRPTLDFLCSYYQQCDPSFAALAISAEFRTMFKPWLAVGLLHSCPRATKAESKIVLEMAQHLITTGVQQWRLVLEYVVAVFASTQPKLPQLALPTKPVFPKTRQNGFAKALQQYLQPYFAEAMAVEDDPEAGSELREYIAYQQRCLNYCPSAKFRKRCNRCGQGKPTIKLAATGQDNSPYLATGDQYKLRICEGCFVDLFASCKYPAQIRSDDGEFSLAYLPKLYKMAKDAYYETGDQTYQQIYRLAKCSREC